MKALTFSLRGQPYGVPIEPVREIIGLGEITPVPLMPGWLRGVMNLRGSVVPVIDLGLRLGLEATPDTERTCILMVEVAAEDGSHLVGVVVDAVQEVLRFDETDIAPPPSFGTRVAPAFITGMQQQGQRRLVLLAIERVLAVDDLEGEVVRLAAEV